MKGVCSIFSEMWGCFRGPSLNRRYAGIGPSTMPGGLAAGRRWWRCCSVIWAERSRYGRSAVGCRRVKASCRRRLKCWSSGLGRLSPIYAAEWNGLSALLSFSLTHLAPSVLFRLTPVGRSPGLISV
jgi:hypothetical protein